MPVNNWNNPQPLSQGLGPHPELSRLENDSQLWLIVAVAGFFVGTMFVTGPLSWYQGNKLCESYRAIGAAPSSNANAARLIGMISSIFTLVCLVGGCLMGIGFFVFAAAQHR